MTEQQNTPKLRFPEFREGWESYKLNELRNTEDKYSFTGGPFGSDLKKSDYTTEGIQIIQLQNIGDGYFDNHNKIFTSYAKADSLKSCNIFPGDIIIAKMADPLARATILPNNNVGRYLMASDGIRLSVDTQNFDKKFVVEYINSKHFRKKAENNSTGSTRMRIGLGTLGKLTLEVPTTIEQRKIGEFFSKLDRQIELEEEKLELLEQQKRGYMQKIFSQELRFKDENGNTFKEWKNTNFNYFMSESDNLEKGNNLRKDQLLTVKLQGNGVSKANVNRALKMGATVYYKRFAGQFIYGKQNFFNGAFGIVPKSLDNFYSSGDVPALNIDYSKIDSDYFINYISRDDYYKKKEAFSTGTGSKRIHEKTLLRFDIMLPSVEEQRKIGAFFSRFDTLIEKQSDKVELLKERKKGFLQKMFV
ncbi:restriction endonuclease subunit S [Staphylococcus epidermidis]|nr:restriction endonuclease subunit S [Staphylococcus epidermidis]MCG2112318.1 restriction endonuclease subunit S [Staphylococcus epidermidis]